jgi:O-antigen/teichoic acid export membrane protein
VPGVTEAESAGSVDWPAGVRHRAGCVATFFQTLFTRPGARAAAGNFGWMVVDKGVRLASSILVGFWVARYLGPERFGLLSYLIACVGIGSAFVEFGLDGIVRREVLRNPDDAGKVLAAARCLRLGAGAVAALVLVGGVQVSGAGAEETRLALILALLFLQPGLSVADLWLHARLQARAVTLAQMPAILVGAGVRIGLILTGAPLVAFAAAMVAEAVVAVTMLNLIASRSGLPPLRPVLRGWCVALARDGWPLLISSLAVMVYLRIDTLMLRHYLSEEAVGVFVAATRISESSYFVPVILASSVLPALLRAREQGQEAYAARLQQYYDASAALAYIFAAALILAAPWLIPLAYGPAYAGATTVLMVHAFSQFGALLGVARGQFLVNEGYTRFYLLATLAGAAVNVLLNMWLIPRHGPVGAAWATVVAQIVSVWGSSFAWKKTRATGWMQARALLVPVLGWRHLAR